MSILALFWYKLFLFYLEITMLTNARRVATVRAATMCDLFILSKENLYIALEEFPEMRVIMEHVALDRLVKLKKKVRMGFLLFWSQFVNSMSSQFKPLMLEMTKNTLKILRCSQRKIFKVILVIFRHYAQKA